MEKWKSERERSQVQNEHLFVTLYQAYTLDWIKYRNSKAYDLTKDEEALSITIINLCIMERPSNMWIDVMDGVYRDLSILKRMDNSKIRSYAEMALERYHGLGIPTAFDTSAAFLKWLED